MSKTSKTHKKEAPRYMSFAVVTISTSRYNDSKKGKRVADESGDLIAETLLKHGNNIDTRRLIPDDKAMIEKTLKEMLQSTMVDAIITTGGTGINPSDVTIETIQPMLEKELPGFGEIFRQLTYLEIGSPSIMSRAVAGVAKGKAVFCLPGSPNAVKLCLEKLILPEAGHIILHARGK